MKAQSEATVGYWWVNHGPASSREIEGGYLWSPKRNRNGGRNAGYDNMPRAVPGDVVFSHADGRIGAVGLVLERVRTAPAPAAEHTAVPADAEEGWLLPVRFERLRQPLVPKEHWTRLKPLLPPRQAPLRVGGGARGGVHLAAVPAALATRLGELLAGQLEDVRAEIEIETDGQLTDAALEERIWRRTDLGPREKHDLVRARAGQGSFRASVERVETHCRVTGVLDRRHLRVSHIKPWRACDDLEKLDGFNGLLFSPHIEQLFSRGHICFMDNGELLISEHLNRLVKRAWGLERARTPQPFRPGQRAYLEFHREHVFEKLSGGRRR